MKLTKKQAEHRGFLRFKALEDEGLDYAIRHYSNWDEIKDPEFRRLQENYCDAADRLENWIRENCPHLEQED